MASSSQTFAKDDYTVGWICALPAETAAARGMLDDIHQDLQEQDTSDHNSYILGQIQNHKVVIASLPVGVYGVTSAATVAKDMLRTFQSIRFGLMVGIGGAAPSLTHDIRLGDVVVSQPDGTSGGVIQYDRGKTIQGGEFRRTGVLNSPPTVLLTALGHLQAEHEASPSKMSLYLSNMLEKYPKMRKEYTFQGVTNDCLYQAEYDHLDSSTTCESCDSRQQVQRQPREDTEPQIHYGNIASANQVMRHGATRDRLRNELSVLCFEMEAAGLMSDFPCLVIRGICDYSDSHKSKKWQIYAAATAAAFTKELLCMISAERVRQVKTILQVSGQ
jgi:nucleoside phosphorylase